MPPPLSIWVQTVVPAPFFVTRFFHTMLLSAGVQRIPYAVLCQQLRHERLSVQEEVERAVQARERKVGSTRRHTPFLIFCPSDCVPLHVPRMSLLSSSGLGRCSHRCACETPCTSTPACKRPCSLQHVHAIFPPRRRTSTVQCPCNPPPDALPFPLHVRVGLFASYTHLPILLLYRPTPFSPLRLSPSRTL